MIMLIDQVAQAAKTGVEANRVLLAPDGDWAPVLVGHTGDAIEVVGFELRPDMKDAMVDVLSRIVRERGYRAIAVVNTAWTVSYQGTEAKRQHRLAKAGLHVSPAEHPDRREVVLIQAFDPEVARMQMAFITRHKGASPTLGEWEVSDRKMQLEGRFMRLAEALR